MLCDFPSHARHCAHDVIINNRYVSLPSYARHCAQSVQLVYGCPNFLATRVTAHYPQTISNILNFLAARVTAHDENIRRLDDLHFQAARVTAH